MKVNQRDWSKIRGELEKSVPDFLRSFELVIENAEQLQEDIGYANALRTAVVGLPKELTSWEVGMIFAYAVSFWDEDGELVEGLTVVERAFLTLIGELELEAQNARSIEEAS